MSEYMPEDMPEDLPDRMLEFMPEHMPEDMPDRMPEDMSEDMSDRMPEDLGVTKCINVMVGITRSKVISLFTRPGIGLDFLIVPADAQHRITGMFPMVFYHVFWMNDGTPTWNKTRLF